MKQVRVTEASNQLLWEQNWGPETFEFRSLSRWVFLYESPDATPPSPEIQDQSAPPAYSSRADGYRGCAERQRWLSLQPPALCPGVALPARPACRRAPPQQHHPHPPPSPQPATHHPSLSSTSCSLLVEGNILPNPAG